MKESKAVAKVADEEEDFSGRRSSRRAPSTRTKSSYAEEEVAAVAAAAAAAVAEVAKGTKNKAATPKAPSAKRRKRKEGDEGGGGNDSDAEFEAMLEQQSRMEVTAAFLYTFCQVNPLLLKK